MHENYSPIGFILIISIVLLICKGARCTKATVTNAQVKQFTLDFDDNLPVSKDPNDDVEEVGNVNYLQRYRPGRKHQNGFPVTSDSASVPKMTSARGAVRIFDNDNFEGEGSHVFYIRGEQCLDLPYDWRRKVASIDTLGLCVLLWEFEGCNGSHRMLRGDEDQNVSSSRLRSGAFTSFELC